MMILLILFAKRYLYWNALLIEASILLKYEQEPQAVNLKEASYFKHSSDISVVSPVWQ